MNWLNKIIHSISGERTVQTSDKVPSSKAVKVSKPVFENKKQAPKSNEIQISSEISDEQIQSENTRSKYITVIKNADYTVKNGDTIDKIAQKYGVTSRALLAANGLTEESAKRVKIGSVLKIPETRKIKNVKNLGDIAKAMGVSLDFIKMLKKLEDSEGLPETKFHNTPYKDLKGMSIGIGHYLRPGDKKYLTDTEVCTLCATDLLTAEEHITTLVGGKAVYDKIPAGLKEAVLDFVFNKGVVDDDNFKGLIYCLKSGKWEAAINKLTFNKTITTNEELSGLSKRRLLDISLALKIYKGEIPQSNINTAQQVYDRGITLLRAECKKSGLNFKNQLAGYNKDIQNYFGNRIKLKYFTE